MCALLPHSEQFLPFALNLICRECVPASFALLVLPVVCLTRCFLLGTLDLTSIFDMELPLAFPMPNGVLFFFWLTNAIGSYLMFLPFLRTRKCCR